MAITVRLTVLTGPHKGNRFCFQKSSETKVGRDPACEICMCGAERDLSISRRHCQFRFTPPNLWIEDLASLNGTFVNGQRCEASPGTPAPVEGQDGDVLTIGGTSMRLDLIDCRQPMDDAGVIANCAEAC